MRTGNRSCSGHRPWPQARPLRWLWVGGVLLHLAGCDAGVLNARGPVGHAEKIILIDSLAIMLAIVVPVILATLGFAWWYRASNKRARYLPEWESSGRVELVVWFIPTMVIILLGGVTWIGSHELDPARPLVSKTAALEVQAVSLDWKWLFIYPQQHVASVNQLIVPAGAPVHFSLTSASVLNAFFVPELGSMIYTMNGMVTQLNLEADEPGTLRGLSSHYSGEGFSDMHFQMQAVTPAEFAAWVERTRAQGPKLDSAAYAVLERQSINVPAHAFGSIDETLFMQVATQQRPQGPGPATEHSGEAQAPAEKH